MSTDGQLIQRLFDKASLVYYVGFAAITLTSLENEAGYSVLKAFKVTSTLREESYDLRTWLVRGESGFASSMVTVKKPLE